MDNEVVKKDLSLEERLDQYTLNISEIFYSIEGEGIRIGEPTLYIRVIGCPHRCSWCDTPYSIGMRRDPIPQYNMTLRQIVHKIEEFIVQKNIKNKLWIQYTGGSPDWFIDECGTLMEYLINYLIREYGIMVRYVLQISGGIYNPYETLYYSSKDLLQMSWLNAIDYKPAEQNIPFIIPIKLIREEDQIKFLIKDEETYNFVKQKIKWFIQQEVNCKFIITTITNNKDDHSIIDDHVQKLKYWTERILNDKDFPKQNIKILPREHVLLWGNKRGV